MKLFKIACFGLLIIAICLFSVGTPLYSQTEDNSANEQVYLEGLELSGLDLWTDQGIEEMIEAGGISAGETYTMENLVERANQLLTRLQEEGLFEDIRIELENSRLLFKFVEFPRISEVSFEGNFDFSSEQLREIIFLQPGEPASPGEVNRARRDVSQFYRMQGYDQSEVDINLVQTPDGYVKLQFLIDEGAQKIITGVFFDFEGVNLLQRIHRMWGIGWSQPVREGMPYSNQTVQAGMEAARRWYRNRGHMEVEIEPRVFFNQREDGYDLLYYIKEGPVYTLGDLKISDNQVYDDAELLGLVPLSIGDVFSQEKFLEGLQNIEDKYQSHGYIEAVVMDQGLFQMELDEQQQLVNIQMSVIEGEPFYVERIEIHGNQQTYDRVIRRELRLREGDLLEGVRLRDSRRRLMNLGFFRAVEIDLLSGFEENKRIIRVRVEEGPTGHLQFGGGYSSATGFTGRLQLEKDNFSLFDYDRGFTGRGESLKTSFNIGQREDSYRISWSDPWINDSVLSDDPPPYVPVSFGFSGFQQVYKRTEGYDEMNRGGSMRLGREFGPALSNQVDLEYSFRRVEVYDLDAADTIDIPADYRIEADGDSEFQRSIGSIEIGLQRDRRDVRRFPTEGYYIRGSALLAADFLGGNSDFYKPTFDYRHYLPFVGPTFWAVRMNYRTLDSWKDDEDRPIPSFERFRLGGFRDVRAYDFRDIMLRDDDGERLGGGNSAFFVNFELRSVMIDNTMQLFLFGDAGAVYEKAWDFSASEFKRSVGAGLRIHSPIGPMVLSWGRKLDDTYPGAGDAGESRVDFTIGTGF